MRRCAPVYGPKSPNGARRPAVRLCMCLPQQSKCLLCFYGCPHKSYRMFCWKDASSRKRGEGHISSFPHMIYFKNISTISREDWVSLAVWNNHHSYKSIPKYSSESTESNYRMYDIPSDLRWCSPQTGRWSYAHGVILSDCGVYEHRSSSPSRNGVQLRPSAVLMQACSP